MKKLFLLFIFGFLTYMTSNAQKVEKENNIELRISNLEENNLNLNHNLDIFENRNKDKNIILINGLIFQSIGGIILSTKSKNHNNITASTPFLLIGSALITTSFILTIDNNKWITKNKRLRYKERTKLINTIYEQ